MGGVIFKIFITRWHYIELGNNTNLILSFYVSFWQDSTVFLERKLTAIILCHIKHHRYWVYFTCKLMLIKVHKKQLLHYPILSYF